YSAQHRRAERAVLEQFVEIEVAASLDRGRLQVLDAIDRARYRKYGHGGVGERAAGENLTRAQILLDHGDDPAARRPCEIEHPLRIGEYRRAAGQRHPERFAYDVHGIRGSHAGANTRTANGVLAHAEQLVEADLARHIVAGPEKHFLDVDVVVVEHAARLVPTRHHDGRNVDAGSCHQLPWHGLVTRGEADHAVEPGALDLHLDVVGDQVAHRQNVVAAMAGAVDEVARRRSAHFERQPAGGADRF